MSAEPSPEQRPGDVEETDEADRPAAELQRGDRTSEEGHADGLVGDVGGKVQADERYMEAAHEKPDREQPETLGAKRLLQGIVCTLRADRAGGP